ncbi:hypothetical protein HYPSUDRAFT_208342 [Hypholoma sublateritium FD-334 SS-4]|uniref:Uncharacterized protein n=1 Tax=Hypholoma sublateritium (strain FD-334 SS-4) TaxID=945553 RepID=A0A0D2N6Y9_HYPSF|nr:hypothetical protein HYPSUDRAFT_208342 [Hypholoma sublateritium FD-334 SS-4]
MQPQSMLCLHAEASIRPPVVGSSPVLVSGAENQARGDHVFTENAGGWRACASGVWMVCCGFDGSLHGGPEYTDADAKGGKQGVYNVLRTCRRVVGAEANGWFGSSNFHGRSRSWGSLRWIERDELDIYKLFERLQYDETRFGFPHAATRHDEFENMDDGGGGWIYIVEDAQIEDHRSGDLDKNRDSVDDEEGWNDLVNSSTRGSFGGTTAETRFKRPDAAQYDPLLHHLSLLPPSSHAASPNVRPYHFGPGMYDMPIADEVTGVRGEDQQTGDGYPTAYV